MCKGHFPPRFLISDVSSPLAASLRNTSHLCLLVFLLPLLTSNECVWEGDGARESKRGRLPILDVAGWRCEAWKQTPRLAERQPHRERQSERKKRRRQIHHLCCLFRHSGHLTHESIVVFWLNHDKKKERKKDRKKECALWFSFVAMYVYVCVCVCVCVRERERERERTNRMWQWTC